MLISNIRAAGADGLHPARRLLNATAVTGLLLSGSAAWVENTTMAPRNPFLADSYTTLTHFDSAQTDAVDLPAPVGVHQIENADARWVPGGLVNISFQVMPPLADGTQYALAANSQQVAKIRIDDNRFELINLLPLPNHADADQRQYKCGLHHDRRKAAAMIAAAGLSRDTGTKLGSCPILASWRE